MSELGEYLREVRKLRGFTLREAAKRTGVAHSRLYDLERGISSKTGLPVIPTKPNLEGIARGYKVDLEGLVARSMLSGKSSLAGNLSVEELRVVTLYRELSPAKRGLWLSIGDGLKSLSTDD